MSYFPVSKSVYDQTSTRNERMDYENTLDSTRSITNYLLNFNYMEDPIKSLEYILPQRDYQQLLYPPFAYSQKPAVNILNRFKFRYFKADEAVSYSLYWSLDGKRLYLMSSDCLLTFDNIEQQLKETPSKLQRNIDSGTFLCGKSSHNSEWMYFGTNDGKLRKRKMENGSIDDITTKNLGFGDINSIAFSPSDVKYITSTKEGFVAIWDINNSEHAEFSTDDHKNSVTSCDWHPYNSLIFTGDEKGKLHIRDARSKELLSNENLHNGNITSITCHSNGNWIMTGSTDCSVKLYDLRMMRPFTSYALDRVRMLNCCWDPSNESQFITSTSNNSVYFWNVNYSEPIDSIKGISRERLLKDRSKKDTPSVISCVLHPMGHLMATMSHIRQGLKNRYDVLFWTRAVPGDTDELEYSKMYSFSVTPTTFSNDTIDEVQIESTFTPDPKLPSFTPIPTEKNTEEVTPLKRLPDNFICEKCRRNTHFSANCPNQRRTTQSNQFHSNQYNRWNNKR